jgi:hypothetical protein
MSLRADLVTAEVVSAFREAGIRSVLLRGPAIARWLYDDDSRSYGDVDLLIRPADVARAERVLADLGFADETVEGLLRADRPTHAHPWGRARDGASVDLHHTLLGASVTPDQAWEVLIAAGTETISVNNVAAETLNASGRAVVVVLHAAQHGRLVPKPLEDLTRAVERVRDATWKEASELSDRLGATAAFAAGLWLVPAGVEVAGRLGLSGARSTETALRAATAPSTALGFDWIAQTPGVRAKLQLTARKLAPDAAFMRAWSPLARRGRLGLGVAYAGRIAWLVWHAPTGFRAWRRAEKGRRRIG